MRTRGAPGLAAAWGKIAQRGAAVPAMLTVYSDRHRLHHGQTELIDGHMLPCFEKPARAEQILARVGEVGLGPVVEPEAFGLARLLRVHDAAFVEFLAGAWQDWLALGRTHDALPLVWPVRGLRTDRLPDGIDGRLGYYAMDAATPITAGTWEAAKAAADVALTAAREVGRGASSAFALCRPPGHHAAGDLMGGYCYLNNAAIAAQYLLDEGAARVAVLDVDYHHGNGTQSIFYSRADVLFVSLHGDPRGEYPYFLGYEDERGTGNGDGFTRNYPLPPGTTWASYAEALADASDAIRAFAPDAVVVSLGVDTFEGDPISRFALKGDDFPSLGSAIATLGRPTVFVMEGGYAVEDLGVNAVAVLTGFEEHRKVRS
jgi:acetoin utilization deacetylase AcuC-like enzyme